MSVAIPHKSAFEIQRDVIWALYLRETKTRFGLYRLGLVWAIIEPLATTIILGVLLGTVLQRMIPNIPYPMFVLGGFLPFRLFSNVITSNMSALGSNQGLLVYRQVVPLDPFVARLLLECVFSVASFVLFLVVAAWFGIVPDFGRPLAMMVSLVNLVMMATGLGILAGVHARRHPETQKIVPLLVRPLFYLSCIIHPLGALPVRYQHILLFNPLAVTIETFRDGMFDSYSEAPLSLGYPFGWGALLLAAGLAYYRREHKILHEVPRQ